MRRLSLIDMTAICSKKGADGFAVHTPHSTLWCVIPNAVRNFSCISEAFLWEPRKTHSVMLNLFQHLIIIRRLRVMPAMTKVSE